MRRWRRSATSQYINTGDWVESCTAVVEHFDGRMEIIHWPTCLATPSSLPENFVPVLIEGGWPTAGQSKPPETFRPCRDIPKALGPGHRLWN